MLLTLKENKVLNDFVQECLENDSKIEWVSYDECNQYRNTQYESMIIGFGHGEHIQHINNVCSDEELTHYYQNQILYYVTVFRIEKGLRVVFLKTVQGQGLNYAHQIKSFEIQN